MLFLSGGAGIVEKLFGSQHESLYSVPGCGGTDFAYRDNFVGGVLRLETGVVAV